MTRTIANFATFNARTKTSHMWYHLLALNIFRGHQNLRMSLTTTRRSAKREADGGQFLDHTHAGKFIQYGHPVH